MQEEHFGRGDKVKQVAPIGLMMHGGFLFVQDVLDEGLLVLSPTTDGPPLTDLGGQPRHFPKGKFHKIPTYE